MSQSTIIEVETGLDKYEIFCGSRTPAVAAGVELNETRKFRDNDADALLASLPDAGAGRFVLFAAIREQALSNKDLMCDAAGWLTVSVSRHD